MPEVLRDSRLTASVKLIANAKVELLKTLAYFDIFQYPLKRTEIRQFLGSAVNDHIFEMALEQLLIDGVIFFHHHLYSLQDTPLPAIRRIHGNLRAAMLLPAAHKTGRFLFRFPFVRGIGVSGSLSKNFADEIADIDFFIITKANRLWIARTLMHLFKKLAFLRGREHFYCMNYYIDEQALLLQEKNIFTAIEIKTLLPVSGEKTIVDFFSANQWADEWLPVCEFRKQSARDPRNIFFKKCVEVLLNNKIGNWIDNCLMRITVSRWRQKEQKGMLNQKGLKMGLITGKHFARSNPGRFQEKVLNAYEQKVNELKKKI